MLFPSSQIGFDFVYTLIYLIAMFMALFVATPVHEFAHAFAARREGDYTAVAYKRYTLAFHKHFDWKGFLFLILFRFGWAKPVPVDERNFKRGRKSKLLVASAGIIANLILGTLFLFIYFFIFRFFPEIYNIPFYGLLLNEFLLISVSINFMLAFVNLLPIYPLDGFKIIDSFCRYDNKFLDFMKKNSLFIFLIFSFSGLYYLYYSLTGELLISGLTRLFIWILGF